MLANSVSVSCGIPMTMPYVAIRAAFDCIISMFTLTFLRKSKVWLITLSTCSNTSFMDGRSAPLIASFITLKIVKLLMLLWSLPSAVRRMALVMSLPTSFVKASTMPSFTLMTD